MHRQSEMGGEKAEKWKGQIFLFLNEQINK